jgi:Flp pilus assembly protein TadB
VLIPRLFSRVAEALASHRAPTAVRRSDAVDVAGFLRLLQMMQAELRAGASAMEAFKAAAAHVRIVDVDARFTNPFTRLRSRDPEVQRVRKCCVDMWELHHERGMALGPLLATAEQTLVSARDAAELVKQETASVRASATMLTVLPVMSPLLGLVLGCNPWQWLLFTKAGWLVAFVSTMLLCANLVAVSAIARGAAR